MDFKKVQEKINALFSTEEIPLEVKPTRENFVAVTLEDGTTVIEVEPAVEVGAAVLVDVEGEFVPTPDGDYVLEDGRTITVVGGLIDSITEVAETEEPEMETEEELSAEREPKVVTERTEVEKKFAEEITKKVDYLIASLEAIQAKFTDLENDYTSKFKELGETVKEVFSAPAKEPIKKVTNPLKRESKNYFTSIKK